MDMTEKLNSSKEEYEPVEYENEKMIIEVENRVSGSVDIRNISNGPELENNNGQNVFSDMQELDCQYNKTK